MFPMFHTQVAPLLRPPEGTTVRTLILGTVGMGESDIATKLGPLMARDRNPLVGTTASGGVVSCRLRYQGPLSPELAERQLDEDKQAIVELLGPHVFAIGHNSLPRAIIERLTSERTTLSVVESCTGGLLGAALTDIPGSSAAFLGGLLTYSNELKMSLAGVPASVFNTETSQNAPGAVSSQCATAMAEGGRRAANSDYCLSITGVAGPGGGSSDKPVGTVWIGLAARNLPPTARRFAMVGERPAIRSWSVAAALAFLWIHLQGRPDIKLLRQTS
jgi:nicotinamide-nucleotide amidase